MAESVRSSRRNGSSVTLAPDGSLMVSGHQGTFSLGLLAAVGSLSVLLASLSVLPAFLRLVEEKAAVPRRHLKPALTFKRWLLLLVGKELP